MMPLDNLSDAEFTGVVMNHHRQLKNDFNGGSIRMAQEFANRQQYLTDNRARIETVLGPAALADFDSQVAAVDAALDKLFVDGLQSQKRADILATNRP